MFFDYSVFALILCACVALGFTLGMFYAAVREIYFNAQAVRARRSARFSRQMKRDPLLRKAFLEVCDYHLNT